VKLLQLSIAHRLWLGLTLILGLFAVAHLVSLRATGELDRLLSTAVSDGQARSVAVQAMKIHLDTLERAARAYVVSGQPQQRERAQAAGTAFEQALRQYQSLAVSEDVRALAVETGANYAQLREQAERLWREKAESAARIARYEEHRRALRALLDAVPPPDHAARQSPPVQHQAAVDALRASLLRHVDPALALVSGPPPVREHARSRAALARYREVAQTPEEQAWARKVRQWLAREQAQSHQLRTGARAEQSALAQLTQRREELDRLLDRGLQPAAKLQLNATVRLASDTVHHANVLTARVLILALVLAVFAAAATSRSVRAPLRALVTSTRRFARGDLAYRAPVTGRDELSELTVAFNDMAAQLQASTVSRSYMESVVNCMGEALFVMTPAGVIETANPAAQRLLGYSQQGMLGLPFAAIASVEAAHAMHSLPARFDAFLKTRDGTLVPAALSAVAMPCAGAAVPAIVCIAQDLRERIAAAQHQRQTQVVFENTREGVVLTDAERNIVTVNPAFVEITGYTRAEVQGRALGLLWAKHHHRTLSAQVWSEVDRQGQWQGEIWIRRKGGELRPVWKNISVVRDSAGCVVNHVAVFSDITAIKDAEERLHYIAYHDALTDLPNRLLLHDRLASALDRAARDGTSVALLYLDLDNFKHVNDTLGHEEGDRLLQAMAARIGGCVRGRDRVARLGGDEFVVIEEGVRDPREAAHVAERILEALSAPVELAGLELRMRASIGISLGPRHGESGEALLKAADAAMYRAKRNGRSSYAFFSEEMTRQALERLTLENALRHPSLTDQLVLQYQPQVEILSGRLVGVEALVRWNHPVRGLLGPNAFVPIAEDAGLVHLIGDWVLRSACRQAREWMRSERGALRMSVNVSAYQLRNERILESVAAALRDSGLPPELLELEVTEGALQTGDEAGAMLERFKQLGVHLALDDFGTGYSALSSLKLLPFDRLKIDRAFVRELEQDANDRALVKAIIAMGRSLGLDIIAEGVETPGQLAFLRKEGCDEMQGFLISAPLDADELERALLGQRSA
jgi:diguanylate cyclase (GGDEF)-like protein/PAS domain S-box-containing protein